MKKYRPTLLFTAAILAVGIMLSAWTSTARTLCGKVKAIDRPREQFVFLSDRDHEERVVGVKPRTNFYRDGEVVSFEALAEGATVELVYRAPLFGDAHAVKLRWAEKRPLISSVCGTERNHPLHSINLTRNATDPMEFLCMVWMRHFFFIAAIAPAMLAHSPLDIKQP